MKTIETIAGIIYRINGKEKTMQEKRMIDKTKFIRRMALLLLIIILVVLIQRIVSRNKEQEATSSIELNILANTENSQNDINNGKELENKTIDKITVVMKKEETLENKNEEVELDWNLLLVNTYNKIPDGYQVQLESIDQYRSFDIRAIQHLTEMMQAIRYAGISNVWIQSAYRNPEDQQTLFEDQVQAYIYQGYNEKTARELTEKEINKPWHSEHNLGLAVDFNYVNREFEDTAAFQWLQENAQDYGFILRYAEEKEKITKVRYEPWHWRYVGEKHAEKMKKQDLCLEEYIEQITK